MNADRRRRALITRPQEDAAAIAVALARRGITPVLAPMMRTEFFPVDIDADLAHAQAVLFTSRNGVRAFSRVCDRRDVPVFAVGDSTAALARDNGFSAVESAGGNSADLARYVTERLVPSDGTLLHIAGETVAGDLSRLLSDDGFEVVRRTLYDAKPIEALSTETTVTLRNGEIDYVLFFSPRTAATFVNLVAAAELTDACSNFVAICLSEAVANELQAGDWKAVKTAAAPTAESLLQALDVEEPPAAEPDAGAETTPEPPRLRDVSELPAASDETDSREPETQDPGPHEVEPPDPEPPDPEPQDPEPQDPEPPEPESREPLPEEPGPDKSYEESAPAEEIVDLTPLQKAIERATERASEASARPHRDPEPVDPESPSDEDETEPPEKSMTETSSTATPRAETGDKDTRPQTAPAPRSRAAAVAWTLLVAVAVIVAGYVTLPMWRGKLPDYVQQRLGGAAPVAVAADGRLAAELVTLRTQNDTLRAAVSDLGKNLDESLARLSAIDDIVARQTTGEKALEELRAELREAARPDAAAADAGANLAARIDALEKSVADLAAARTAVDAAVQNVAAGQVAANRKTDAGLTALAARISALESAVAALGRASVAASRADTIALAAGQLRDALARTAPFGAEVATLKRLAGDNPAVAAAVAPIEKFAAAGVPSRAALIARMPAVVEAIVIATRESDQGDWIDRTVSKLRGFVSVRRVDGKGGGTDAIVARAEAAAGRGDLAAAVDELGKLEGRAAAVSETWLDAARARLALDTARATLNRIVLDGLATSG